MVFVLMVCETSGEMRESWIKNCFGGFNASCLLTLDFVPVDIFSVVYVASRHFMTLYFCTSIIVHGLIKNNYLKRCIS